jgi:hypothetical protein
VDLRGQVAVDLMIQSDSREFWKEAKSNLAKHEVGSGPSNPEGHVAVDSQVS